MIILCLATFFILVVLKFALGNLGAVYGLQPGIEHAVPHREPHVLDHHSGDVNHHTVATEHHGVVTEHYGGPPHHEEPGKI